MESQSAAAFMSFIPMVVATIFIGLTAHYLAKEKGRNVTSWTILGCIPIINFFFIWFFVGAANLKLERKIDRLLAQQKG